MRRVLLIVSLSLVLIFTMAVALYFFFINFGQVQNELIATGKTVIIVFTGIIILRYLFLLFFSLLQIIKNTADLKRHINYPHVKKISLIVPAYNEDLVIAKALTSLLQQTYSNLEIIVIDDGSTDKTYSIAKQFEFTRLKRSLKVLRKLNAGKANAINYAIERSSGELIMVVDADSDLKKNAVTLLASHFDDPSMGAVAGSVLIRNQTNIWTKLQALEYIQGLNLVKNGQAFLKLVNIVPGPIGLFRKKALIEVGLYKDDTYAEDCDITLQLIAHGYKVDYEMDAIAYTEAPDELLDLIKQRYRWTRGILQAIKKHKRYLWDVRKPWFFFTVWYMLFEAVFWPIIHLWVGVFIVYLSFVFGASHLIFYWWIMFTVLDMAGSLYSVLITKDRLTLVFYSLYYRIFYIQIMNVAKVISTLEEVSGVKMYWGKLKRIDREA